MEVHSSVALPLAMALELDAGEQFARRTLTRDEAAELAALVADDLRALIPNVEAARLAFAGALFDSVELLRPGFPIWATLEELARRVPREDLDHVVGFGTHDGHMPTPVLEPTAAFAEGALRLLPMVLLAPPELAGELGNYVEDRLIGRGEAGGGTADWIARTLGVRLAHVRYLSRNDLLAVICAQYDDVNLGALWQLVETALLAPQRGQAVMTARGLALAFRDGDVFVQSPAQWLAAQTGPASQRAHAFAGIVFELRQYAALLAGHGIPLKLEAGADQDNASGAGYLIEMHADVDPGYDAPALFAHEAPGLGIVAVSVAQRGAGGTARMLAHAYPLGPDALHPLLGALARRYPTARDMHALGQIWVGEDGALSAPSAPLH